MADWFGLGTKSQAKIVEEVKGQFAHGQIAL